MSKFSKILMSLLCIIGFTSNAFAASYASSSITVSNSGERFEYISGLPVDYVKSGSYNLYVLNTGTNLGNRSTLSNPTQANGGFAYIANNSNVTSSSYKNYYIASVATLWYQDYLNGNDGNISSELKNYINSNTNDTVCFYIIKLVNNAKNYSTNGNNIRFIDKDVTFSKNGSYYYSNVIDVETYNLSSNPSVKLYNAPSNTTIINNTVSKNGIGSFQIKIPASSLTNFSSRDFEIYITGGSSNNIVYKYRGDYGEAVYARTYSSNGEKLDASIPATIEGIGNTRVRISVLDKKGNYISGLSYSIYYGDCTYGTCYSDDLVKTFTTKKTYTELNNTLSSGTYTLVKKSNSTYNLPTKTTFVVNNDSNVQDVTIEEDNYYYNDDYYYNNDYYDNYYNNDYYNNDYSYNNGTRRYDTLRKVNIYNKINDSSDVINIYTISNSVVKSYRSNNTNYEVSLSEGTYYITDTHNKFNRVYFKINSDGDLLVRYNDEYVLTSYISLDNDYSRNDIDNGVIDKKYDEETNTYYVDGLDDSIIITNDLDSTTDVKIEWLSNMVDCPITSLNATVKYILGAMVGVTGLYLVIRNVKKKEINI